MVYYYFIFFNLKFSSLSLSHSLSLSLRIPGFIKNEYLKLESPSCTLVLSLNALNDINNATTLTVLVQYNKAPSSTDHDLKIVIRNGSTELYISDQAPEATNQTQGMIILVNFMNVGLNFRRTHGGYGPVLYEEKELGVNELGWHGFFWTYF